MRIKKEKIQREKVIFKLRRFQEHCSFFQWDSGFSRRQNVHSNSKLTGLEVLLTNYYSHTGKVSRKCCYREISIKVSWFKEKFQIHLCVLHTWIAEKLELGLEISLSLFGLLATLEQQRSCNWHANTLLHCPNSVHSQYRVPFSLWDCCEMFPYKTNSVVSGRCAAQHEKVWLFSEQGSYCFPREISTALPSVAAPVISTCRCVQKHRGKEEEKLLSLLPTSLLQLQHSMASLGMGWTNTRCPQGLAGTYCL